ncbi:hypothetical protein [Paenibacillus agaridevorans]|uniref:hypothetical protein n=1 Tax=Paenibacillus agaridevorans TaxID=171404 RepID=UPI001BE49D77|nr:hypothetical protein [Paenibacillus agaridevorans]
MQTQFNESDFNSLIPTSNVTKQLLKNMRFHFFMYILLGIVVALLPALYLSESWANTLRESLSLEQSQNQGFRVLGWIMFYLFFVLAGIGIVILVYNLTTGIKMRSGKLVFPDSLTEAQLYEYLSRSHIHSDIEVKKERLIGIEYIRLIFMKATIHTLFIDEGNRSYTIGSRMIARKLLFTRYGIGSVKQYVYTLIMNHLIKKLVLSAGRAASQFKQEDTFVDFTGVTEAPTDPIAKVNPVTFQKNVIPIYKRFWFWILFGVIALAAVIILVGGRTQVYELTELRTMNKEQIKEKFGSPDEITFDENDNFWYGFDNGFMVRGTERGAEEVTLIKDFVDKQSYGKYKIADIYLNSSFDENVSRLGKPDMLLTVDDKKTALYMVDHDFLLSFGSDYKSDAIFGINYAAYNESTEITGLDLSELLNPLGVEEKITKNYEVKDTQTSSDQTTYLLEGTQIIVDNNNFTVKEIILSSKSVYNAYGLRIGDDLNKATDALGTPIEGSDEETKYRYVDNSMELLSLSVIVDITVDGGTQKINRIHLQSLEAEEQEVTFEEDDVTEDIWSSLSIDQQIELNRYFSFFSEVEFGTNPYLKDSSIANFSTDDLIRFAIAHNIEIYPDDYSAMLEGGDYFFMPEEMITETVKTFFDVDIRHKSVSGYQYENNAYLWSTYRWAKVDATKFSQVNQIYMNADGTYTAEISIYDDYTSMNDDIDWSFDSDDTIKLERKEARFNPIDLASTLNPNYLLIGTANATIREANDGRLVLTHYQIVSMY